MALPNGQAELVRHVAGAQSCVLLKNDAALPLGEGMRRVAVIGPMAHAAGDQLGCWVLDADHDRTRTVLAGLRERLGDVRIAFEPGSPDCRSLDEQGFEAAVSAARDAGAVALCLGEAHCHAHLGLPGGQQRLPEAVAATGTPVVAVLMAGRPLVLGPVVKRAAAVLLVWHPGSMAGSACAVHSVGHADRSEWLRRRLSRRGSPPALLFPFGYGLGYTEFVYSDIALSARAMGREGSLDVSILLTNVGGKTGQEVVQMYVCDLVGSVTRPMRELKAFRQVTLTPGESRRVAFTLEAKDLGFCDIHFRQPGAFRLWIGPNAAEGRDAISAAPSIACRRNGGEGAGSFLSTAGRDRGHGGAAKMGRPLRGNPVPRQVEEGAPPSRQFRPSFGGPRMTVVSLRIEKDRCLRSLRSAVVQCMSGQTS